MYIRTKNKIYQVESILRDNGFVKGYNIGYMAFITKDQVIKQSENLEELCDEFILIEPYADRKDVYHHRDKKSFIENYIGYEHIDIVLKHYTIYGAIWTDKGLIYVAKMNDKGELELI